MKRVQVAENITFINADCMEIMKMYEDDYFDLAIVDPPYNIESQQKRGLGSRIDVSGKMNEWNCYLPDKTYFDMLFRVSENQIIWGANNYEGLPRTEYFCLWNKLQSVENFASLEYAWVSKGVGKPAKMFTYSIHKHNASKGKKIHPTMKPISLYKWLLENYSKPGQKILDTHLGSGSHAIAAYYFGVGEFIGIELDKDCFEASIKRFKEYIQKHPKIGQKQTGLGQLSIFSLAKSK